MKLNARFPYALLTLCSLAVILVFTTRASASDSAAACPMPGMPTTADSCCTTQDTHTGVITVMMWVKDTSSFVAAKLTRVDSTGATVPIPNVTIAFYVQRLFGLLPVGGDDNTAQTDANGEASVPFPNDIPGDAHGGITLVARVQDNPQLAHVEGRASSNWGVPVPVVKDPFPRALWEPNAPVALIITFSILFGGVWITYGFVISQLFRIKKEKSGDA